MAYIHRSRTCRSPLGTRRGATTLIVATATLWCATTASAQLDPLLFIKRVPPTVIIVVDTSRRMLEDGNGGFYDPNTFKTADDPAVSAAFGLSAATAPSYRRIYRDLAFDSFVDASTKFQAATIDAVPSTAPGYATFWDSTRLEFAKAGIASAVSENAGSTFRWGLLKLRQTSPAWRGAVNCDKPVRVTGNAALAAVSDSNPCNAGSAGKFALYAPSVASPNYSIETSLGGGAQVVAPAGNTSSAVLAVVRRAIGDSQGLIPASSGTLAYQDRPLTHALDDARTATIAAMAADSAANRACRNTVVILITSGSDGGDAVYAASHNPATVASSFLSVSGGGVTKRVPVYVIGLKPDATHEAQLQTIATNSGGLYRNATSSSEVAAAINYAVQAGFARATDFNAGTSSEFIPVSPIVGTVNLKDAKDSTGAALPNTDIIASPGGQSLSQRSNVLLTGGFTLPGFDGALRAFRTYKPVVDTTKPTGWKFVKDSTRLWPDLDGRPSLAGQARVPADPNTRNIYTYIPDGAGRGAVTAFTTANAAALAPHMGTGASTGAMIATIRAQALGAIIGSTPAMMDSPSLDPPPDNDYGRADAPGSFAGVHKDRRAMIFFGANDGMIHAIDARTGYEVWAFIPYNLLPKLRTLADGQSVEQFDYFVDSSPKIAEVKIGGAWRSLMIIGEGPGGTFYQAFDVTEAGMGVPLPLDSIASVATLLGRFDVPDESIRFKWAFPNYNSFDPTYTATFTVADGTPGGKVKIFGDLKAAASYAEKTVGYTWSDPAVGSLTADRSTTAVIVGSGYFPDIETLIPSRGAAAPKAGNALYLLDVDTGLLRGNPSGATCPTVSSGSGSGTGCISIGDVPANGRKNALQADPTAAGDNGSIAVTKAYFGDIDGNYWRFDFNASASMSARQMINTSAPIYASSALLFVGSVNVYMYFATGSDLLATTAPGGTGTFRLYGLKDMGNAAATVQFAKDLATVTNVGGIATGERPSTSPSVAGDIVFYTTTKEVATTPCADFTSNLYGLTYQGGAAYDADGNGTLARNESPIAKTLAGRATAPFIVDQHLYLGTAGANGTTVESFGDPQDFNNGIGQVGVRILSWREIR